MTKTFNRSSDDLVSIPQRAPGAVKRMPNAVERFQPRKSHGVQDVILSVVVGFGLGVMFMAEVLR